MCFTESLSLKKVSDEALLWWWCVRQGLDGSLAGATAAEILARTGWARSVGGSSPYLALHARGGWSREAVDSAAANVEIQELPSARGCTYVLPACDYGLGLAAAVAFGDGEMAVARKLGVTEDEVDRLCEAVRKALAATAPAALDPESIRDAVGGEVRSLGEEGKKKGLTSTLPLALGRLQLSGEIRRVPSNGRLDQQRYKYTTWNLTVSRRSSEEVGTELARRFFRWIGPATMEEFRKFSGLGVKAAKAAVDPLGLVALPGDRLLLPEDADALGAVAVPKQAVYALVSTLDWIVSTSLADRDTHPILDRGRVIGEWVYDPSGEGSVAWRVDGKPTAALKESVRQTEEWVREQLGDVRSFSLDSPKSRAPRIARIREAASASGRE